MSGDSIVYQFGGIESVAGAIQSFVGQMNSKLDEVDGTFNSLIANGWSGQGADAFQQCKQQWHQGAQDMAQTLHSLSQKVNEASTQMAQADSAAARNFGG
jgi:WXG100 family type VII secretion target